MEGKPKTPNIQFGGKTGLEDKYLKVCPSCINKKFSLGNIIRRGKRFETSSFCDVCGREGLGVFVMHFWTLENWNKLPDYEPAAYPNLLVNTNQLNPAILSASPFMPKEDMGKIGEHYGETKKNIKERYGV